MPDLCKTENGIPRSLKSVEDILSDVKYKSLLLKPIKYVSTDSRNLHGRVASQDPAAGTEINGENSQEVTITLYEYSGMSGKKLTLTIPDYIEISEPQTVEIRICAEGSTFVAKTISVTVMPDSPREFDAETLFIPPDNRNYFGRAYMNDELVEGIQVVIK